MEVISLAITKDIKTLKRFLMQTSNAPEERRHFNEELLSADDIFDIDEIELTGNKSITSRIVKAEMKAMGLEMINDDKDE